VAVFDPFAPFNDEPKEEEEKEIIDLNTFEIKGDIDFGKYEEQLTSKLKTYTNIPTFSIFLKNINRVLCSNLKVEQIKDIIDNLTLIMNDKIKQQRDSNMKKKKGFYVILIFI
jgi:hypothetical protein